MLFFVNDDLHKTYDELFDDVKGIKRTSNVVNHSNPYELFKYLLCNLVHGISTILIDSDFSDQEISRLRIINEEIDIKSNDFISLDRAIDSNAYKWRLSLFTSGTTGKPKKIEHTFDSLTRAVRKSENRKNNCWAFAYNPTHFAGLQVFFQAFLNKNKMVYIFDKPFNKIEDILIDENITNISATPTFYKNLIPFLHKKNTNIKRVTMGGEKIDKSSVEKMKKIFPDARFTNIYASTEAGNLFASNGNIFTIPENIIDKVRFSEKNELLLHESLLGKSDDLKIDNSWYYTGDIVDVLDEKSFCFRSRQTEVVNIAGYNVNIVEVEDVINSMDDIQNCRVFTIHNSVTGNILSAEVVVLNEEKKGSIEKEIKAFLKDKIQYWKIPRIITVVEKIKRTRTGKKERI